MPLSQVLPVGKVREETTNHANRNYESRESARNCYPEPKGGILFFDADNMATCVIVQDDAGLDLLSCLHISGRDFEIGSICLRVELELHGKVTSSSK